MSSARYHLVVIHQTYSTFFLPPPPAKLSTAIAKNTLSRMSDHKIKEFRFVPLGIKDYLMFRLRYESGSECTNAGKRIQLPQTKRMTK